MGRDHFPKARNTGKYLRENFRPDRRAPNGSSGVDHHCPVCNLDRATVPDGGTLSCDDPVGLLDFPYVFGYRPLARTLSRNMSPSAVSPESVTATLNMISVWSM